MEIYKDKYIKYIFEEENSLLIFYWSKDTENMSDEKYKELMLKGVGYTKLYQPKYLINNSKEKTYLTTVEIQEWAGKYALSKIFNHGVIKFAIVECEDILIQLSTEQAAEEGEGTGFAIKFFASEDEAREWFFE